MAIEGSRESIGTITKLSRDVRMITRPALAVPNANNGIPQSERDIINMLKLDEHAAAHPAPESGERMEQMDEIVVLDGIRYTRAAVKAALESLDDETLSNLLKYPHQIMSHNNLSGNESTGGNDSIQQFLLTTASRTVSEKLLRILDLQPAT